MLKENILKKMSGLRPFADIDKDKTVKCFKEFHINNPAISTKIKIWCIFVSNANFYRYVIHVCFHVKF